MRFTPRRCCSFIPPHFSSADVCLTQESANYAEVEITQMSRKQISFFLVDYAKSNSLNLRQLPFEYDGSFFMDASEDAITMIFGCKRDHHGCRKLLDSIRTCVERTQSSQPAIEQLQASFSAEYMDPFNVVKDFVSYVDLCARSYRKYISEFYSPYIALVQTSGSGKSRLLRECADLLPTLYICFRTGKSGYPPYTSKAVATLFENLDRSQNLDVCIGQMVGRLRRVEISARINLPRPDCPDRIIPYYDASKPEFPSDQLSHVWNLSDIDLREKVCSDSVVLLVLDEATWLLDESSERKLFSLNMFHFFRRALAKYWADYPDARLFAVMVDTSAKIENFAPNSGLDNSARQEMLEGGGQLLHPYILRGTFDAYFERFKLPKGSQDLTPLLSTSNHLFAGRPLIAIPFSDSEQQLGFISRKLFGGATPDWTKPSLGHLSVVLSRLGTSINCQSPFATELVAGHMSHLLASDLDRVQMFISYLAEPRLALAAAMHWLNEPVLINCLMPALYSALVAGTVGAWGEVVAQIILLIACDTACVLDGKRPGDFVPLEKVLEQLLPVDSTLNVLDAIPVHLRTASVACGQIVQLAHNFDLDTNVRLAERHCGASFAMQQGVDLILPIIAKSPAFALFQCKNFTTQDFPCQKSHDCTYDMLPSIAMAGNKLDGVELASLDENCVRVFMQLGAKAGSAILSPLSGASNLAIAKPVQIFGLSSRCLSEGVRDSLQLLIKATNKVELFVLQQKSLLDASKAHHPFPDNVESMRKCFPFVIDPDPRWTDYTVRQLKSACDKYGLKFTTKCTKTKLIESLNKRFPDGPTSQHQNLSVMTSKSQLPRLNWNIFSIPELKNVCKKLGLKNYSNIRKADIVKKVDLATQEQENSVLKLFDDMKTNRATKR
jgi:hypothetical protein